MYREYGLYKNKRQMLPNILDGLLPVQKRILLTAHTIARKNFVKTFKVLGETMTRWHPHSEALGTAEWCVQNDFLIGDGLWGSNTGVDKIKCGAPRYTSLKMNEFIDDMAFSMVKSVRWEPDEADPEPIAIPTMIPFCLMTKREISSIAFGFKSDIPCYKKEDLAKRLLYLVTGKHKVIIKPNIIGCNITSTIKDCEKLLKEGKATIAIQGKYKINKNSITVLGWNPRKKFQTLFDNIDTYKGWGLLSKGFIRYDDISDQNGTKIDFEVVTKRNSEIVFERMVEAITERLKDTVKYNIVAISGDNIVTPSVDDMLISAYSFYKETLENHIRTNINKIEEVIKELDIIKQIRPYISEVTKKDKDIDKIYKSLASKTKCKIEDIKLVIDKYKIKKLLSISVDEKQLQKEIVILNNDLKNIEHVCYDKYISLIDFLENN